MTTKFRFYPELNLIFETRIQIVNQKFPLEIKLIESMIERHFHYIEVLNLNLAANAIKAGTQMTGTEPFPALYFQRNSHYLFGSFSLIRQGLTNQATALLRTVFETILETYIILLDLKIEDLHEKYLKGISEEQKTIKISQLLFDYKMEQLEGENEVLFKKLNYLNPAMIRHLLYSEERQKEINKFYKNLSTMSHANITGMMSEIEFNENDILDKIKLLLSLGIANLIVISEAHFKDIEHPEKLATDKLIYTLEGYLGSLPDLIPDKIEHRDKLHIKFPKHQID